MSKSFMFVLLLTMPIPAFCQSVAATSQNLKNFLLNYVSVDGKPDDARYIATPIKFNQRDDGFIVYIEGSSWCGSGGCNMLALLRRGTTYKILVDATITQLPIRQIFETHGGMSDIGVTVCGGGIMHCYEAVLRYNGKTYPENPSMVAPKKTAPKGRVLISEKSITTALFTNAAAQ